RRRTLNLACQLASQSLQVVARGLGAHEGPGSLDGAEELGLRGAEQRLVGGLAGRLEGAFRTDGHGPGFFGREEERALTALAGLHATAPGLTGAPALPAGRAAGERRGRSRAGRALGEWRATLGTLGEREVRRTGDQSTGRVHRRQPQPT